MLAIKIILNIQIKSISKRLSITVRSNITLNKRCTFQNLTTIKRNGRSNKEQHFYTTFIILIFYQPET